jgi:hypothetical protein
VHVARGTWHVRALVVESTGSRGLYIAAAAAAALCALCLCLMFCVLELPCFPSELPSRNFSPLPLGAPLPLPLPLPIPIHIFRPCWDWDMDSSMDWDWDSHPAVCLVLWTLVRVMSCVSCRFLLAISTSMQLQQALARRGNVPTGYS